VRNFVGFGGSEIVVARDVWGKRSCLFGVTQDGLLISSVATNIALGD
jgi:hypothetical protein